MIHRCLKRPEQNPGGELSYSREKSGGAKIGTKDTETKSSGDLLYIGSPLLGAEANQSPPCLSPAAVCGSV